MENIRILIKGAIGNYNFGDDLLTFSMCRILTEGNYSFKPVVMSEYTYLLRHIDNITIEREYNVKGNFDILIYAGGTQFASFSKAKKPNVLFIFKRIWANLKRPFLISTKIRSKIFKSNLFSFKNVAFVGLGVGPFFEKDKYFDSVIQSLKRAKFLSVRDVLSEKICADNAVTYTRGSDLVYTLPDTYWETFRNRSSSINKIGIIIRDWEYSAENGSFLKKLEQIKYNSAHIQFFSFCESKDRKCIEHLSDIGYQNSIRIWNPDNQTFQDYISLLAECDLLITSRYHGAIVASLLNIPFISIGIEPKLTMVAKLFNMHTWSYPYDVNECLAHIKNIDENYTTLVDDLTTQVKEERSKATK